MDNKQALKIAELAAYQSSAFLVQLKKASKEIDDAKQFFKDETLLHVYLASALRATIVHWAMQNKIKPNEKLFAKHMRSVIDQALSMRVGVGTNENDVEFDLSDASESELDQLANDPKAPDQLRKNAARELYSRSLKKKSEASDEK